MTQHYDAIIIGASASGLMCAIEAGKRQRSVLVLDHANKAGKKILMSGGGRCNFTNTDVSADNYISSNPHFCKSALSRFTQWDFIAMVNKHAIDYHERDHGQLFCDDSAADILKMLLDECQQHKVRIQLNTEIDEITKSDIFTLKTARGEICARSVVIATGGLSIPRMCASPFGYRVAEQFGLNIIPTHAGLVPFTLQPADKAQLSPLSGIAIGSIVSNKRRQFRENILFTHRGLSGPAILQLSSYWQPGEEIIINLLPDLALVDELKSCRDKQPQQKLKTVLSRWLPRRLISTLLAIDLIEFPLQNINHKELAAIAQQLQQWRILPNGTEGYRTAEVTIGGVDCKELSSKTMQCQSVSGLYFIGEVVDVSGWLGGYNFQWAWSSGWVAGQYI